MDVKKQQLGTGSVDTEQIKNYSVKLEDLATEASDRLIPDPAGIDDGWVITRDDASPGDRKWAAPAGGASNENTTIAAQRETNETDYLVIGSIAFDKANFSGKTIKFVIVAAVTGGTGTVQLYNLTDTSETASLSVTSTTPTRQESSALTLPTGTKVYEVRIKISVSSDRVIVYSAQFEMR